MKATEQYLHVVLFKYCYWGIINSNVVLLVDISGREYSDLTVNAAPSCEDISHMIRLCPDYSLLGGRLLDTATSLANERATGTTLPGGICDCLSLVSL